jgi:hypothetical protein
MFILIKMSNNTENLQKAIQAYNDEMITYNIKNNKSNGTKVRNALMAVNKLTKEVRKDVLAAQKLIPTKTRVKKETVVEEPVEITEPETPVVKTKKTRVKKI